MPPETHIGRVALRVADLDQQVDFYENVVGLEPLDRRNDTATLGVNSSPLLQLISSPQLNPRDSEETGLFHTAFRFPTRGDLGDALDRVMSNWELTGTSDHLVSEALYLNDPEGNGVELYRDRPTSAWAIDEDGHIQMASRPLDLGPIRKAAPGNAGAPAGTTIGHVHLEISDIEATREFYVDDLGFDLKETYGRSAVFMAAGMYHHHVGANTWNGRSEPGRGRGLDWFEILVPDKTDLEAIHERLEAADQEPTALDDGLVVYDPDEIEVRLRSTA